MKQSLTGRIKRFFQARPTEWINGGAIEELAMRVIRPDGSHYKASNASRRLRESESGIGSNGKPCEKFLEKKEMNGSVWYHYIPQSTIRTRIEIVGGVAYTRQEKLLV